MPFVRASNVPIDQPLVRVTVARKRTEALAIQTFELMPSAGMPLPSFTAGARIDVRRPTGVVRQYSLCNDSQETHRYLKAVLRDPMSRGGSVSMHEHLQEGDSLLISAPRNHFPLECWPFIGLPAHDAGQHNADDLGTRAPCGHRGGVICRLTGGKPDRG